MSVGGLAEVSVCKAHSSFVFSSFCLVECFCARGLHLCLRSFGRGFFLLAVLDVFGVESSPFCLWSFWWLDFYANLFASLLQVVDVEIVRQLLLYPIFGASGHVARAKFPDFERSSGCVEVNPFHCGAHCFA